jgi:FkbM family methyltransferase
LDLNSGRHDRGFLHACAAGAECGETTVNYVSGKEEYSSIDALEHPAISGLESQCLTVPVKTLDFLVDSHGLDPAIIKIDTEGSEHRVLSGASNVLKKYGPKLIMEKWQTNQSEVNRILVACEYRIQTFNRLMIVAVPW